MKLMDILNDSRLKEPSKISKYKVNEGVILNTVVDKEVKIRYNDVWNIRIRNTPAFATHYDKIWKMLNLPGSDTNNIPKIITMTSESPTVDDVSFTYESENDEAIVYTGTFNDKPKILWIKIL